MVLMYIELKHIANLFDAQDGKLVQKMHIFEAQIGEIGCGLLSKVRRNTNLLCIVASIIFEFISQLFLFKILSDV